MIGRGVMKQFWNNVEMSNKNECWEWKLHTDKDGYGRVRIGKKTTGAHRIAFMLSSPEIDITNLVIRPKCCNPKHLCCGTQADNVQDRVDRKRGACGMRNGRSKLIDDDVMCIRKMLNDGENMTKIAKKYSVDRKVIYDINVGKMWRHIATQKSS